MRTRHSNRQAFSALAFASLCLALLCASAASAQSGGTGAPGGTAPPPTTPTPTGATQVFPVPGAHTYGDGFGAGRGHEGQDLFAACGSPTVAVMNTRVIVNDFHKSAGNYVVLRAKKIRRDYVYAHLQTPSALVKGQVVTAGTYVGPVGDTGNASGCHLHFEIWKGKWYRGGSTMNPLASLQAWDAYS